MASVSYSVSDVLITAFSLIFLSEKAILLSLMSDIFMDGPRLPAGFRTIENSVVSLFSIGLDLA